MDIERPERIRVLGVYGYDKPIPTNKPQDTKNG